MESDNPALSLFNVVDQNSLQNQEEEENIEDIRQRQQEIQNFLTAVLDEYNYDESSCDETQKSGLLAYTGNNDQLQVLYEMRCKEVRELLEERDALKKQLEEERNVNENRKALNENLLEQCQMSMRQLQEALIAKTEKIGDYEKLLSDLRNDSELKLKEIVELHNENEILRGDRDKLNEKLNQMELDFITTNKLTERELQHQYLERISHLEAQLKQCSQDMKILESSNCELKNKIQSILRDRNDSCQEKEKYVNDLKQNIDNLKEQNSFLLEELQKTKSDYQKYVEETKAAKQAFEKIKEQIAPSRLKEIDSTVSNLKRLLQEKDDEIAELSKVLHVTHTKSVKDASVITEEPREKLSVALQLLKSDLQITKVDMQKILSHHSVEIKQTLQTISDIFRVVSGRDKTLLDLHKTADCKIDKAALRESFMRINKNLIEARGQVDLLENRVRNTNIVQKHVCDKETNTENENFVQKEIDLRDRITKDFQEKLRNIEEKYKNASQDKFNYKTLKQQVVELATKLHKYKTLYEDSRKGMTEFLTIANNHIKSLENKVVAVERGRQQTQNEMDTLKMLLADRDCKLNELFAITKRQENEMELLRKQNVLEKLNSFKIFNEKFDVIAKNADLLVNEVESEFNKRIKMLMSNKRDL